MAPEFKLILFLAFTPILIFLLQAVISRILSRVNISSQVIVLACSFLGSLFMAIVIYKFILPKLSQIFQRQVTAIIYSLVVYFSLTYVYFHLFNMSETGRRIRILYEIYLKGRADKNELHAKYGLRQMLDIRLDRLVKMHQIRYQNGRYILSRNLLYYATLIVMFWSALLKFRPAKN